MSRLIHVGIFGITIFKGTLLCDYRCLFFLSLIELTTGVLSACVAAVKCRPVLYHRVVIFAWSSGIIDCMLFTFKNRVPLYDCFCRESVGSLTGCFLAASQFS